MAAYSDFDFQKALAQQQGSGAFLTKDGYWVSPQYGDQQWIGQGADAVLTPGAATEYWATKDLGHGHGSYGGGGSAIYEDAAYDRYGADGGFLGSDNYEDMGTDGFTKLMAYAVAAAAAGGIGSTIAGAAGAAGAGGGMGNGAFLGEAAWTPTAGAAPLEFGAGTSAMGAGGSGLGANGAFLGEAAWAPTAGAAPLEFGAGTATMGAGGAGGLGGLGGAGGLGSVGSALGSVGSALGGSGGLLGLAGPLIGGLAGAQGQEDSQTQERRMDPRLDNYVYGANGLMPQVQSLLATQQPFADAAGAQMRSVGSGLLGGPVAPNGFDRFTKGRY